MHININRNFSKKVYLSLTRSTVVGKQEGNDTTPLTRILNALMKGNLKYFIRMQKEKFANNHEVRCNIKED
jgi:hypothetical protein